MNKNVVISVVTFSVFMTEAIIHYNFGVHKAATTEKKFVLPPANDMVKLAVTVAAFSILNGIVIAKLTK